MNVRQYWVVALYGSRKAKYVISFDDKPTANRFAKDAIEIGPFTSATVEAFELNEDFGPKAQFRTYDEFADWHEGDL